MLRRDSVAVKCETEQGLCGDVTWWANSGRRLSTPLNGKQLNARTS